MICCARPGLIRDLVYIVNIVNITNRAYNEQLYILNGIN